LRFCPSLLPGWFGCPRPIATPKSRSLIALIINTIFLTGWYDGHDSTLPLTAAAHNAHFFTIMSDALHIRTYFIHAAAISLIVSSLWPRVILARATAEVVVGNQPIKEWVGTRIARPGWVKAPGPSTHFLLARPPAGGQARCPTEKQRQPHWRMGASCPIS
jgi:hypothetical protein